VNTLNDEQIEFITSGAVLKFIPERQLEHELATRDADSLRTLVNDLMSVAEASEEGRKLHISFDIDVLDPAFAVATGTPVPGGLTMREAIPIVRRLCAESNVVGFDLVELQPKKKLRKKQRTRDCETAVGDGKRNALSPQVMRVHCSP